MTDAEVLQEIRHRYAAINKRDAIGRAFRLRAGEIVQNRLLLSARESVHIAVMERYGIRSILSFDADFDRWPGLKRIYRI